MNLSNLTIGTIRTRLRRLMGGERRIQVAFLLHLSEFESRRGFAELGYASLWEYCEKELGLREVAVWRRTQAARILRSFPQAADYLKDGRLSMTTLVLLRDLLSEENALQLFDSASGKSKSDVEYLVACRQPKPEPTSIVRKLPAPSAAGAPVPERSGNTSDAVSGAAAASAPAPAPVPVPTSSSPLAKNDRATVQPIAEDRFVVRVVVDRAFIEKLEAAANALSHVIPRRDVAAVLQRSLDELLAREAKKHAVSTRTRETKKKKAPPAKPAPPTDGEKKKGRNSGRRAIPADVKRAVWARDAGRCSWVRADGSVCGSKWQLEYDHIKPVALGGESTVAGLRLLCGAHNEQAARQVFGDALVERCKGKRELSPDDEEVIADTG